MLRRAGGGGATASFNPAFNRQVVGFACTPAPASCCRNFGGRALLTSAVPHSWWGPPCLCRGSLSASLPTRRGVTCLHLCPCVCWCAWVWVQAHCASPRFGLKWARCMPHMLTIADLLLAVCPCVQSCVPTDVPSAFLTTRNQSTENHVVHVASSAGVPSYTCAGLLATALPCTSIYLSRARPSTFALVRARAFVRPGVSRPA